MKVSPYLALQFPILRHLIKHILLHPPLDGWSVQGLGMLRFYIDDVARVHIWDPRLENVDVSKIHTHSWDFRSIVIAGAITNLRFTEVGPRDHLPGDLYPAIYNRQRLVCGMGGKLMGEPQIIGLAATPPETWGQGKTYMQKASEIHYTDAQRGTVTLVERKHDGPEGEADVYWAYGQRWVSAEPRPATRQEVLTICSSVLEAHFK